MLAQIAIAKKEKTLLVPVPGPVEGFAVEGSAVELAVEELLESVSIPRLYVVIVSSSCARLRKVSLDYITKPLRSQRDSLHN